MAGNPIIGRINQTLRGESNTQQYGQPGFQQQGYQQQGGHFQGGATQQQYQGQQGGYQQNWNATQGAMGGYAQQQGSMTPEQLQNMYRQAPAGPADTGRLTMDDVIMKSLVLFALTVATAAGAWVVTAQTPSLTTPLWLGGMFGTLILGFAMMFMRRVVVPLILAYAVLQGLFVGPEPVGQQHRGL